MRKTRTCAFLAVTLAAPHFLYADFSYQESTQITGGSLLAMVKMAGTFSSQARKVTDPVISSVYLKGNRLARVSPDFIEIIDLDQETITHVDIQQHTYTVMTFEQMKQQVAAVEQQMEQKQAVTPAQATSAPSTAPSDVKLSFDVHLRQTGATRQVSGVNSNESILTMMMNATDTQTSQTGALAVTNDMWLAEEIPGYAEIGQFYMRMGEKMGQIFPGNGGTGNGGMDLSRMLSSQPGATQAIAGLADEMRKIKGVPVLQVMRMGITTNGEPLPAASEAPLPPSPPSPSAGEVAQQSAASAIAGRLGAFGGLGGFGHKKQADPPPAAADSKTPPTSAVLMEMRTESSNFSSSPIDEAHFQPPAGYKQVQPEMPQPQASR